MNKTEALRLDLEKALSRLEEAAKLSGNRINRDATIQRFEFTFELAWKLMQSVAAGHGVEVYGPRNSIREAAKLDLITDPKQWFIALKSRNLSVHTYKELLAKEVYQAAKIFPPLVSDFLKRLKEQR